MNPTQVTASLNKAISLDINRINDHNSLVVLVYADFEDAYSAYIDLRRLVEYEKLLVSLHKVDSENALLELETKKAGTFKLPALPYSLSEEFPTRGETKLHFGWMEDGWPIYSEDFLPFDGVIR